MPNQPSQSDTELLRAAYSGFNSRNISAALTTMAANVAWPRAFKGGFVEGHQAVGDYWTEQWNEINPNVEPETFQLDDAGNILVKVHQVVRDLTGGILADDFVCHRFTVKQGLIQKMEVVPTSELQS